MGIAWGSGGDYLVGMGASTGEPLFITDDAWGAGDYIRFATFNMTGAEGIVSYKVLMQSVEYDCTLTALGGGIWALDFKYETYPAWAGFATGITVTVDAKVVGADATYLASSNYGAATFLQVGAASNPTPADDAVDVTLSTDELTWDCTYYDEDGAGAFYCQLWKDGTPIKSGSVNYLRTWDISSVSPLTDGSVYTWRVQTNAEAGGRVLGDTWTFTAGEAPDPPDKATDPTPASTATGVSVNTAELSWTQGVGADTEKVYFGPSGSMVLVQDGSGTTFDLTEYLPLSYGTTYQWRIDSTNGDGTTTGDVWSFTTLTYTPPAPVDGSFQIIKRLTACAENRFWYEDI